MVRQWWWEQDIEFGYRYMGKGILPHWPSPHLFTFICGPNLPWPLIHYHYCCDPLHIVLHCCWYIPCCYTFWHFFTSSTYLLFIHIAHSLLWFPYPSVFVFVCCAIRSHLHLFTISDLPTVNVLPTDHIAHYIYLCIRFTLLLCSHFTFEFIPLNPLYFYTPERDLLLRNCCCCCTCDTFYLFYCILTLIRCRWIDSICLCLPTLHYITFIYVVILLLVQFVVRHLPTTW